MFISCFSLSILQPLSTSPNFFSLGQQKSKRKKCEGKISFFYRKIKKKHLLVKETEPFFFKWQWPKNVTGSVFRKISGIYNVILIMVWNSNCNQNMKLKMIKSPPPKYDTCFYNNNYFFILILNLKLKFWLAVMIITNLPRGKIYLIFFNLF